VGLLVPAILLLGSLVLADRPRVVILGPSQSPIVARVRDELAVLGFDVRVEADADGRDLAALGRRHGAAAVARVSARPPEIDLWVDAAPAEPSLQVLRDPPDPALLALRAVELLRARLLPVPIVAEPPPPPPPASPAPVASATPAPSASQELSVAPAPAPRSRGPVALIAGPALLVSPGGVPPAFHLRLGAEWDPLPRFGVDAMLFVPVTAATVSAAEGSISLRPLGLGGGVHALLTDSLSDLTVALGLGLQAMALMYRGEATGTFAAQSGTAWSASPYAAASAAYRFHPRFAVRFDLVTSLVRPEPVLRIAGREAASFGQPAFVPSIDLEVRP
jgi:hypothetical protein